MTVRETQTDLRRRIADDLHALDARDRGAYQRELKRLMSNAETGVAAGERRRMAALGQAWALRGLGGACLLIALAGPIDNIALSLAMIVVAAAAALAGEDFARSSKRRRDIDRDPGRMAIELHAAALDGAAGRRAGAAMNRLA